MCNVVGADESVWPRKDFSVVTANASRKFGQWRAALPESLLRRVAPLLDIVFTDISTPHKTYCLALEATLFLLVSSYCSSG